MMLFPVLNVISQIISAISALEITTPLFLIKNSIILYYFVVIKIFWP